MKNRFKKERPIVCVQGLGFVGTAMATAIAEAKNEQGDALFNVAGVDLETDIGTHRINSINKGVLPFESSDQSFKESLRVSISRGNLVATSSSDYYELADVVVVDVPLDLDFSNPKEEVSVNLEPFVKAVETVALRIKADCLVIVETTVPPGTCEKVVKPLMERIFTDRGLEKDAVLLAHSYERVMPGRNYLRSITDFWRVFSGINSLSGDRCEEFLKQVINTEKFPMKRLSQTVASETSKVLENSYRAMNIAFMEEWGRFAENVGFDLFEVIDAIRVRPTHSNMRQPGFGVGGYCLTKDPLFAKWSASNFFDHSEMDFPFCTEAVEKNKKMPLVTLNYSKIILGTLEGKKIGLFGVSYREDVGDTRFSPSELFAREAISLGAKVTCFDPMVKYWNEMDLAVSQDYSMLNEFDLIIFTVPHLDFSDISFEELSSEVKVIDANQVLSSKQLTDLKNNNGTYFSIGRGYL